MAEKLAPLDDDSVLRAVTLGAPDEAALSDVLPLAVGLCDRVVVVVRVRSGEEDELAGAEVVLIGVTDPVSLVATLCVRVTAPDRLAGGEPL